MLTHQNASQRPSFESQLGLYTGIHAQSKQNEALISYEKQKAALYEKTITNLEAEKRSQEQKLHQLDQMLSSMHDQMHQLQEDISIGNSFATCFTMRSMTDTQDDDTDFRQDAFRRDADAEKLTQRAEAVHAKLRELGKQRAARAVLDELESAQRPHLARYAAEAGQLLALVVELRNAQSNAAAEDLPPLLPQLAPVGEQLLVAVREHLVAQDADGRRLAELACAQLGACRRLTRGSETLVAALEEADRRAAADFASCGSEETVDLNEGGW